ncbi:hypothetical protein RF11_04946 [Thelohanellus kitauei]|uniref:Uncharacterized protein n=1 Tax=Thelohanellus kitauei TaxID=669202 RepID=A0A0C2ID64_THEKT|nr:hypothetical protein RF11_04946 [Thelohanellus kitauei]
MSQPSSFENYPWNLEFVNYYIKNAKSNDVNAQMEIVQYFMSHAVNHCNDEIDNLFLTNFPNELYERFRQMSTLDARYEGYLYTKAVFSEVFVFIFRNRNVIWVDKAISFIELFINFLKTRDQYIVMNPRTIFSAMDNCIMEEKNKSLFINGNVMYHFYNYFFDQMEHIKNSFWDLFSNVYDIDTNYAGLLFNTKLNESINIIMAYLHSSGLDMARMLICVLKMIIKLRMIDQIEFDVNSFFDTSVSFFLHIRSDPYMYHLNKDLSKIWTGILNGTRKIFEIDNDHKLISLSAIFANDLAIELGRVYNSENSIEFSKNQLQRLYIIILTFTLYPILNNTEYQWLSYLLYEIFSSFLLCLKRNPILTISNNDIFHIYVYLLKYCLAFGCRYTSDIDIIICNISNNIRTNPLLSKILL